MIPLKDNIRLERFPLVTVLLVGANVIAYLISIRHAPGLLGALWNGPPASVTVHAGAVPYDFTHPGHPCELHAATNAARSSRQALTCASGSPAAQQLPIWVTALSSMFLHGGLVHLAGNMLFLAIFGPSLEDWLGRGRFAAFYVAGGLVALGLQVLVSPDAAAPTVGAAGPIAAVLGGYVVLFRRARVFTLVIVIFLFTIIELPAVLVLAVWFPLQAYFTAGGLSDPLAGAGSVSYFAHVGGFAFGVLLVAAVARWRGRLPARGVLY